MGFDTEEHGGDVFRVPNGSLAKIAFSMFGRENMIFARKSLGTLKTSAPCSSVSNPIIKCPCSILLGKSERNHDFLNFGGQL